MKVGDLVKFRGHDYVYTFLAVIIEVGAYAGRKDIKVLWSHGNVETEQSKRMVVISESR